MNYAMLEQQRRMWFFRIYQTRMGERRRSHARKDLWFPEPTQFPVKGQWWSNSVTHLGVSIGCKMMGKPSGNLLHTEQCLERSGFCTRQVEQNVS